MQQRLGTDDPDETGRRHDREAAISSRDLLAGRRKLIIDHEGEIYRLSLTRQGKLILTK